MLPILLDTTAGEEPEPGLGPGPGLELGPRPGKGLGLGVWVWCFSRSSPCRRSNRCDINDKMG